MGETELKRFIDMYKSFGIELIVTSLILPSGICSRVQLLCVDAGPTVYACFDDAGKFVEHLIYE